MHTKQLAEYAEYLALGTHIAASMLVPVVMGIYADSRWDLSPWGVIIGALIGFGSMISIVIKLASRTSRTKYRKTNSSGKQ